MFYIESYVCSVAMEQANLRLLTRKVNPKIK